MESGAYTEGGNQYPVRFSVEYPDRDLDRLSTAFRIIAAIPILIVLGAIGAWLAILFTGRYPRGLFDFVVGVMRWGNRVVGYAFILVTDEYPPFRLDP